MAPFESVSVSTPSKVFLVGEYLALKGGPALVFSCDPRFSLKAEMQEGAQNPFHPESPAGKLWIKHEAIFKNLKLEYSDPYKGSGGMGGSAAEFALLHALLQMQDSMWNEAEISLDLKTLIDDFQALSASRGQKFPPSGVDIVGMIKGGLTLFEKRSGNLKQFAWPFLDMGLLVYKTNVKVATHEHLASLGDFSLEGLELAMQKVSEGLTSIDSEKFVDGINEYARALHMLGFVSEATSKILGALNTDGIIAKKGCGALGADVVLVVYKKEAGNVERIEQQAAQLGLKFIANESNLSAGISKTVSLPKALDEGFV